MEETNDRLGLTFVSSDYRRMRRNVLVSDEMLRIPDTVEMARRSKHEANLRREIRQLFVDIRRGRWYLMPQLRNAEMRLQEHMNNGQGNETSARALTSRCAHDECKGYVDSDGTCGICDRVTCARCGAPVHNMDEHQCDDNDVMSIQAIGSECKPCVRCRAPSTRVEGCATMWCASCHTFWNWDTGRVIESRGNNTPHNPDHRAWAANTRHREIGDIPCGGIPDGGMLHMALMRFVIERVSASAPVIVQATEAIHYAQTIRTRFPRTWDAVTDNLNVRIAFINGDIDEDVFARTVERNDRTSRFKRDVGEVLETLVLSGADILQRFCVTTHADIEVTAVELVSMLTYADAVLRHIAKAHGRVGPHLTKNLQWILPGQRRAR